GPETAGPPELVSFTSPLSPPAPASVDRSRPAALARGAAWSCPWPAEADPIDDATVVIAVVVDERGHASKVDVLTDPGYGFGREARRCALREVYTPGLDRDGRAVASTLKSIKVRFAR
ncbi:MAG TPA: energy transducer TonB, partial [Labilithrix sp.]|nr:energy transducer TonB [Labilithrix sp.]